MRTWRTAALFLLAVIFAWTNPSFGQPPHAPDELLVRPKGGVDLVEAEALYRQHGGSLLEVLPGINVHRIRVAPQALEAVERALRQNPTIEFVERNGILTLDTIPDDSLYPNEWHLPKISAPSAWNLTNGSPTITIAIVDTGVDPTHPDLAGKLIPGFNVYNNNADTSDVYGHGTMVAGVAAAISNNVTGVASVAWLNPIMPIRITDASLTVFYSTVANGITWAVDHGAKVINVSISGVAGSSTITSAANYARSRGGLVVAAAGNCGCFDSTPANSSMISVSASDSSDNLAGFSSQGAFVDVAAPGVSISTTTMGGGYGAPSGTSVASPVAAGVVALIWSVNPFLTPDQVESILKGSSDDLGAPGYDTAFGFGRVNAYQAVLQAMAAQPPSPDTTPPSAAIISPTDGSTVGGVITVQVSAQDNVGVARVDLYVDGVLIGSDATSPYSFAWDTTKLVNGLHALKALAFDTAGNGGQSAVATVNVQNAPDTTPPIVTISAPAEGSAITKNVKIRVTATDNVGVVKIEVHIDGTLFGVSNSSTATFNWNTRAVAAGWHTITAKAYDAAGNVGTAAVSVLKSTAGTFPSKR